MDIILVDTGNLVAFVVVRSLAVVGILFELDIGQLLGIDRLQGIGLVDIGNQLGLLVQDIVDKFEFMGMHQ